MNDIIIKRDIEHELIRWKNKDTGRVLQLSGARQVGKTFSITEFAKKNFDRFLYINCVERSGQVFMECLKKAEEFKPGKAAELSDGIKKAFKLYDENFVDDKNTIVIIDEIQESSFIYNHIRNMARQFDCYFVVTGSYLGRPLNKEFFLPAGDIDRMTMYTVTFPEFLGVFGLRELYESLDLFGGSSKEEYDKIREYYYVYEQIGGYPAVVSSYFDSGNIDSCNEIKENIIETFINESERYFEDIKDVDVIRRTLNAIALMRINEKDGVRDLTERLSKIAYDEASGRVTKTMINQVIAWLYKSNIIGYCTKAIDADFKTLQENSRYFYMDPGIAEYFLRKTMLHPNEWKGVLAENFVYCCLIRYATILGNPYFATYSKTNGELDFVVRSKKDYKIYGIEVKSTNQAAKTANAMLQDNKIDYAYFLKGNTYGGIEGKRFTVPLFLADRLDLSEVPIRR